MSNCSELVNAEKSVEPNVDLGNILLVDLEPLDKYAWRTNGESYLLSRCQDDLQYLVSSLWQLPKSCAQDSTVVDLPAPAFHLPREKPVPKMKPPTKWEEYAKLKGIQRRKKSRMVWVQEANEWRPRWGYKRANDDTKDWLIEISDKDNPVEDYFAERMEAKKERIAKNELQRLKNIARSVKESCLPDIAVGPQSQVKTKQQAFEKIERARKSTASVGIFQERLRGEKLPKGPSKKRRFLPNEVSGASEKERYLNLLQKMDKRTDILNVDRAIRLQRKEGQEANHVTNMENGKEKRKRSTKSNVRGKQVKRRQKGTNHRKKKGKRGR
ncbi:ribosome biogenesis regulatory protein [Trichuris trichiura]|uniref:Ribosome biogenesis regulatory protein n=1 Tax=Trichuris trichiura TaxID=36087 RepID=A0A077ZDC7_TRITR|nr:ribosome biogenesis regulatory protein [Trichuris trichiura]